MSGGLTASGTLVFDGAHRRDRSLDGARFRTSRSRRRAGAAALGSNVTVNGNLTQTSGTFQVSETSGTFTIAVSGNAQFQGGTLVQFTSGIIDVAGNVTFSGTSVTASPDDPVRRQLGLRRRLRADGGTVELDGAGATTIAHAVAGRDASRSRRS